ncbi:MAG TPA: response regulator transcription factor [Candidatus Jeotgalibaca pullicola]|uniref:Response regulator transcription factor n=1 Tax=Jeotgalibaca ciconiae TaxID=2496265 RepID=A0A3S9HEH8_9LACT|nr:response regulator transcription factor [Jeotgalibaca ciconiae]HJB24538.1 response regulator transcription factor [Candidatus Jeotgalibaca pullicola]
MLANSDTTILIVDDEERIRRLLKLYLTKEGYASEEAADGVSAIRKMEEKDYDMVLLDIMLPEIDGLEVIKEIRKIKDTPIIMITARGDEGQRVEGFQAGADDYIVKPFSPREVMLRVAAILKRTKIEEPETIIISYPELDIFPESRLVLAGGEPLTLTPKEFDLILYLAENPEKVFTREMLLKEVWRYDYFGDLRTVDTHIKRLREKLQKKSLYVSKMIVTVWGTGYKFSPLETDYQKNNEIEN